MPILKMDLELCGKSAWGTGSCRKLAKEPQEGQLAIAKNLSKHSRIGVPV